MLQELKVKKIFFIFLAVQFFHMALIKPWTSAEASIEKGTIITIAGNGKDGFSGDGGPATKASIHNPRGVVVDPQGNIYISDASNNRVRKVDAKTGIITTVAGDGARDHKGDGGPAVKASLAFPVGLAIDKKGNLFIADARNQRIRKVDARTGIITTVAGIGMRGYAGDGGPALSALLSFPTGVAVDEHGNIYIADSENGSIRMVNAKTGVISVLIGGTPPGLKRGADGQVPTVAGFLVNPYAVVYDGKGNIYVSDSYLERVKKVNIHTRKLTIAAGQEANKTKKGYCGDGGPAKEACFAQPGGLAVDPAGNIYIADINNDRIRRVDAKTGIVTTVAGTGTRGFNGEEGLAAEAAFSFPSALAFDNHRRLLIVDSYNNRVREMRGSR